MSDEHLILPEKIDRSQLLPESYLISLVYAAIDAGLYTEDEMVEMQAFAVVELEKKVHAFTRGESTSVRTELAERFMESLFYTAGVALLRLPTPEDAVEKMRRTSFTDLSEEGLLEIRRRCRVLSKLSAELSKLRIPTRAFYYRYATEKLIPQFLRRYNAQFLAHETAVLPDYPLLFPVRSGLTGILFMQRYLQGLYTETQVLRLFPAGEVERLLRAADPHYADAPENILRPVLLSALGAILAGSVGDFLRAEDMPCLLEAVSGSTEAEVEASLRRATEALFSRRGISAPKTVAYLSGALPSLARETVRAVQRGTLACLYPTSDRPSADKVHFRFGRRMDDDDFSRLLLALEESEDSSAKNALIRERVHSLYDLEDVLIEHSFTEEEAASLLSILSDGELAFLLKKHPELSHTDEIGLKEGEIFLSRALERYLTSLPAERGERVARLSLQIDDSIYEE